MRPLGSIKGELTRPTVFNEEERKKILEACKWADKITFTEDYEPQIELLDQLGADIILHGDDIILNENHESIYTPFEKLGKLKWANKDIQKNNRDFNH